MENYFPTNQLQIIVKDAFTKIKLPVKFRVTARIHGGVLTLRLKHFVTVSLEPLLHMICHFRKELKPLGFLKRDPRAKERRKFGLKKARKSPQWSKR